MESGDGTFYACILALVLVAFIVVAAIEVAPNKAKITTKIQRKSYGFIELEVDKLYVNRGLLVLSSKEQNYHINPQHIHTIIDYKIEDSEKKGVEIGISDTSGFIIKNIDIDKVLELYKKCQH